MKKLFAICLLVAGLLTSVHSQAQDVETLVQIDTDMGKIKVKLFNDTPQHRDNFIKNVKRKNVTNGLLFHRVIKTVYDTRRRHQFEKMHLSNNI